MEPSYNYKQTPTPTGELVIHRAWHRIRPHPSLFFFRKNAEIRCLGDETRAEYFDEFVFSPGGRGEYLLVSCICAMMIVVKGTGDIGMMEGEGE